MLGKRCRQIRRSTSMSAFSDHPAPPPLRASHPPPHPPAIAQKAATPPNGPALPPPVQVVNSALNKAAMCVTLEEGAHKAAMCVAVEESACHDHILLEQTACTDRTPTVHESTYFSEPNCTTLGLANNKPGQLSPQAGDRTYYMGSVRPYFLQGRREAAEVIPPVDFLDACFFCKRRLGHGRDIFIYKGDAAFCSEECRHHQILSDERREKCSVSASKKGTAPPTVNAKTSAKVASSGTAVAA